MDSENSRFVRGVVVNCMVASVGSSPAIGPDDSVSLLSLLTEVTVDLKESTEDYYKVSANGSAIQGYCNKKYIALPQEVNCL